MKQRIIGIDLLRILSMLGIIGLHIMNQGGIMNNANLNSISYIVYLILLGVFFTSVNIFGIISGYLNIEKTENKNKRIIELIFTVLFWSIVITGIFYCFNLFNFRQGGIKEVLCGVFPSIVGNYWYITCYVLVFFMIPFLNNFLNGIDRKTYKKLLFVLFIMFCIIQNLCAHTDLFRIEYGYSPFWLMYLYMIGGYIKKYGIIISTKRIAIYLMASIIIACTLNYIVRLIGNSIFGRVVKGGFLIDYISPFTLISSIMILLLFEKINIKSISVCKIMKYFSGMAFSVYVIHIHKAIFYSALTDLFAFVPNMNIFISVLVIIGVLISTYLICCILDELRKLIFKLFRIDRFINYIGLKLDKVLN